MFQKYFGGPWPTFDSADVHGRTVAGPTYLKLAAQNGELLRVYITCFQIILRCGIHLRLGIRVFF